ncbi:MAG TPA: class I SAM-dependent methyltransferase [Acidimicrobiales bacterium]|nr:class I SAM-dependent methyltransferase [Acidimicrobiales bacterium]
MDATQWDSRYATADLVWSAEPNRFLTAEVAGLAPGRALDVACGEGRNAIWLATAGWTATGVDFSAVALDKARRLAASRGVEVEWVLSDVVAYFDDPHEFDLVAVFYLQLPPPARRAVLSGAARAVAPGGRLLVVAHDSSNLERGYGGPQEPSVLYRPEDVVADLADALEIEKAEVVERPVSTDEGERVALDLLVRAVRPL